jgi:hypothetical protein
LVYQLSNDISIFYYFIKKYFYSKLTNHNLIFRLLKKEKSFRRLWFAFVLQKKKKFMRHNFSFSSSWKRSFIIKQGPYYRSLSLAVVLFSLLPFYCCFFLSMPSANIWRGEIFSCFKHLYCWVIGYKKKREREREKKQNIVSAFHFI